MNNDLNIFGAVKVKVPDAIFRNATEYIFNHNQVTNFDHLTSKITSQNNDDFAIIAKKPNRLLNRNTSKKINEWVCNDQQIKKILKSEELFISKISKYETQFREDLNTNDLDIFYRLVRKDRMDVGPPHYDQLIWEQGKGTNLEVIYDKKKFTRWKLWIPLLGSNEKNSLQFIKGSHLENVPWYYEPSRITQAVEATKSNGSPAIDPKWIEKNEHRFKSIAWEKGEGVIFDDKLVHRGPINKSSKLRTSIEFTILAS